MKIESLQVIRAYAACLVAMCHIYNDGWLPGIFVDFGGFGVDLFFILSGFIMCLTVRVQEDSKLGNAWNFIKRRIVRIFPIYLICSIPLILFVTNAEGVKSLYFYLGNILLLPSFTDDPNYRMALPPGWTLVYEMLFYYLFASFLLIFTNKKNLFVGILTTLVLLVICTNIFELNGPRLSWVNFSYIIGDYQLINFALGIVLYFIFQKTKSFSFSIGKGMSILIISSIASMVMIYLKVPGIISNTIPAFIIVSTFLFIKNEEFETSFWNKILFIGNASYSIYLTHFYFAFFKLKAIAFVGRFFSDRTLTINSVDILFLIGAVVFGGIFYQLIEKPLVRKISTVIK